jgi:phage/plasmid primase-like uncharacterized protein
MAPDTLAAFRAAIEASGLPAPADLIPDGKLHRFRVNGDRRSARNGWYVLYPDDPPAAAYGCWKRGISSSWCARSEGDMDREELAAWRRRMDEARKTREAEERRQRERTAARARQLWDASRPADPSHPYLVRKGVQPRGIRQLGERLVVPVTAGREIHGLQFIDEEGTKRFLRGTPKRGHYHALGRPGGTLAICEGYATAATIREATGLASVVAFDAGNLRPVAEAMRDRFPDARIIVAGDNDQETEGNPGRTAALAAAEAVRGVAAVPEFGPGEPGSDWNDLAASRGIHAVATAIDALHRRLPRPLSVSELIHLPEPEEQFIAEGLLPVGGNALLAGYPKSGKTNFLLELAVAAGFGRPFLDRFRVPRRHRIGIILMEDRPHRVRRRLERLCEGHGVNLGDLQGWLHLWFRPPLRLSDAATMAELQEDVEALRLELLMVDSWAYTATGDSNDADEVTPQLQALSVVCGDHCTPLLVHHARKTTQDKGGDRLTDLIRNSSAFGAWFDAGLVLSRADESSPIKVRAELRDLPAPEPFSVLMEDQFPIGPDTGTYPSGWLRLRVSETPPALLHRAEAATRLVPAVEAFLAMHPGCSKRQLRDGVEARNADIEAAFDVLVQEGRARYDAPEKRGQAGRCFQTVPDRAPTVPGAHPEVSVPAAPHHPEGVGRGHSPSPSGASEDGGHGEGDFECARGCGQPVGSRGTTCVACNYRRGGK